MFSIVLMSVDVCSVDVSAQNYINMTDWLTDFMIDNCFLFLILTIWSVITITTDSTDSRLQELILYYLWCHDNNVDTPLTTHHTPLTTPLLRCRSVLTVWVSELTAPGLHWDSSPAVVLSVGWEPSPHEHSQWEDLRTFTMSCSGSWTSPGTRRSSTFSIQTSTLTSQCPGLSRYSTAPIGYLRLMSTPWGLWQRTSPWWRWTHWLIREGSI